MPVSDVLDFIDGKITAGSIRVDLPRDTFMSLLRLCIEGKVFEFNGKYYIQRFGLSMSSSLSPVLAGLYMEFFETERLYGCVMSTMYLFFGEVMKTLYLSLNR